MISPSLISGAILGWALGANNAANCFATAVTTRAVKYSVAVAVTGVFVVLGAWLEGAKGVHKLSGYAYSSGVDQPIDAFLVMFAAAFTITLMTILKYPVSTSQAIIGSIMGSAALEGKADFSKTSQFFGAWFATPLGALVIGYVLYRLMEKYLERKIMGFNFYDRFIKTAYIAAGAFSAYSLGANNVANVTSVYAGELNLITSLQAQIIGGLTIALGVITFAKPVMMTVGEGITPLSPLSGFVSVLTAGIVVYIYAQIGIPVSTSQAIVGAVVGIGLVKGTKTVNYKTIRNILFAWFGTPTIGALVSAIVFSIYKFL